MKKFLKHAISGIFLCIRTSLSAEATVRITTQTPVVIRYTLL